MGSSVTFSDLVGLAVVTGAIATFVVFIAEWEKHK